MSDSATDERPLVVWTTVHPWIQGVVAEVCPDNFRYGFCDIDDPDQAAEWLPRADFLVTLKLAPAQVGLLGRCRLVMHNGVGYDAIDLDGLAARGIPVAVTPAMTPEGVAEHVFMLVLALSKQLPAVQATMRDGGWGMLGWREGSHNVAYKTLGIVGLGRIGKRVAHLAHAFGCQVVYTDIVEIDPELEERYGLRRMDLDTLLRESDIVTMHVPLTEATQGMIGAEQFAAMKRGAIYINASRGPVTDLAALHDAVVSGHLFGAGIDVFDPEPPPPDLPLLQLPNVICTPHIASGTVERQYAINRAQFANAQRVLDGLEPNDVVV
ncbi:MAG: NAD(P)-dependent oxidoreductase [Actinomycetota bacterium]